ncbi:MAG: hypothetical protein WBO98_11555 [Candidatus Nitrotoga sp.]
MAKFEEAVYVLHGFTKKHNKPRNATSILPQSVTVNCNRKGQKNECASENN